MNLQVIVFVAIIIIVASFFATASSSLPKCPPFIFPNGTRVSFSNPFDFVGYWPSMHEINTDGERFPWAMSLCNPLLQARGAPICEPNASYMTKKDCETFSVVNPPVISANTNNGGKGLIFSFPPQYESASDSSFFNTVVCNCNPSHTALNSSTNSYRCKWQYPSNYLCEWIVSSRGCCIDPGQPTLPPPPLTPTPPPTTTLPLNHRCSPFTFANGSVVSFSNVSRFVSYFASLQQTGAMPGDYSWSFSLCDPLANSPFAPSCSIGSLLTRGSGINCDVMNPAFTAITAEENGNGVVFHFDNALQETGSWTNKVTCLCDRAAAVIEIPSNSYNASLTYVTIVDIKWPVFSANWTVVSRGCCVEE